MNGNGWELDHGNSAGVLNAADGFSLDEALNLLELFIERPDARRLFREEGGDVRLMEGPSSAPIWVSICPLRNAISGSYSKILRSGRI